MNTMALTEDIANTGLHTDPDQDSAPLISTKRPELKIKDAARATGVSVATIRRDVHGGRFPGAHQLFDDPGKANNPWVIPIEDLLAAGYAVNAPAPADERHDDNTVIDLRDGADDANALRIESQRKDLELAQLRGDRDVWRARAEERDRTIEMTNKALNVLPAATAVPVPAATVNTSDVPEPEVITPSPQPRRRRFWQRSHLDD